MRTPPLRAPIEGLTIYPVRSDDDAAAAIGWLTQGHPIVAVDTETTGLDFHADVRLVQFGDQTTAWVMDPHRWRAPIEMLAFSEIPLVAHNAPFDMLHLARLLEIERDARLDFTTMADSASARPTTSCGNILNREPAW